MTTSYESNNDNSAPCSADVESRSFAELHAECARLAQSLQQLEAKCQQQRQLLAVVQAERDTYRRLLYPDVWQQFTEEELRRFAEDENVEDGQRLEQFLGELEDIVNGHKRA